MMNPSVSTVVSVADEAKPADIPVHIRGDVYEVGNQRVPRGTLSALDGLVARAEGRELDGASIRPVGPERLTSAAERRESPVASRLRAFGTNGNDPRIVTR